MELNNYKKKFKELFDKFYEQNFELSAYHCDNLLKFLDSSSNKSAQKIIETPFFSDLILNSLHNVERVTTTVKIFLVGVVRIMIRNELQFCKFMQRQGGELVVRKLSTSDAIAASPVLRASCTKMCSEILTHSSGIVWTIQHKIYALLLQREIHFKPFPTAKIVYEYISMLVWKLDEYDEEEALTEVLTAVVTPIKESKYQVVKEMTDEADAAMFKEVVTHLNVFLTILNDTDRMVRKNKVIAIINNVLSMDTPLNLMLEVTRLPELVCLLNEMLFRLAFGSVVNHVLDLGTSVSEIPHQMTAFYYNLVMVTIVRKRSIACMFKFTASCVEFWSELNESIIPTTYEKYERIFDIKDQFLFMLLLPLFDKLCDKNSSEQIDAYGRKMTQIVAEHLIKAAYATRTVFDANNFKTLKIHALKELCRLIKCLNDKQAGYIYQVLFYNLCFFVKYDEDRSLTVGQNVITCPDEIKIISLVLEMIKSLLKRYNINWYESVEIVSLQNCLMNLLMQETFSTKQLLQALDLIDLSIKKLLSPDLALLVESRRGSTLNEIVAMMKTFLQHPEWEVRDSALQLLFSCTDLAHIKYIPLQKLLHDNGLLVLAANAAVFDEEMYVQATALRCLAAATKIESIWRAAIMSHSDLFKQIIQILRNHPEGIVRKEAANVLTEYYRNQKSSPGFTNYLLNVMTSAALNDLHWEVQLVALDFWKATIQYETLNRGVIDGKFPSVTFCKVRRKIMVLNDRIIQEQLIDILNALAVDGCLKVLINCLSEDSNIKVLEKAYAVAKVLMTILDIYTFSGVPPDRIAKPIEVKKNDDVDMETFTLEATLPENVRDQVIESISNTNQTDLILEMYENSVDIKPEAEEATIFIDKWVDPNYFLTTFRSSNYENMIESKMSWDSGPKNLDSLLNELLLSEKNYQLCEECDG